ncbi:hypothetical protein H6G80_28485 [Nostoc sp. FACHB-87]|uniref:hypothetical protein n=1 Tax=Nostocaceae TaxID=1162 RepID=UPI001688C2B8|nr:MULTISPECIES: hypothetical protein [Nostocaceae]MBD2457990.1 hypothetical protein [Nostoc sp. FACHB-87]MBD2479233.1 hypothetical protein [Anabaena sp. FACHB-83]
MKVLKLSFNPDNYIIKLDPNYERNFLTFSGDEQEENTIEWIGNEIPPLPARRSRKPSPLGKYIYPARDKFMVRIWDEEAHHYGTFEKLEEAVAIRDLALKAHHPHLLEKLY